MLTKKRFLIALLAVLILAIVGLMFLIRDDKPAAPSTSNNNNAAQNTELLSEEQTSNETETSAINDPAPQNSPAPNPQPAAPKISITGKQQAGQTVQISAVVNNLTAGTCQVTLTGPQGTQPFARTSPIISMGNYYKCTDINIPVADFSKAGNWHMEIFAANQNNKSNIAKADILITK